MAKLPDASIVRIFDAENKRVVGTGFLVSERHVLTCAHVVATALGLSRQSLAQIPQNTIGLDFPLVKADHFLKARVVSWTPPQPNGGGDIAGLELLDKPPEEAQTVPLILAEDLWDHPFRAMGFPAGYDNGVLASGRILSREATGWIQIEDVKQSGYFILPGFSGGAVWDDHFQGVVGMIVAADTDPAIRSAFTIPADTLLGAWPALKDRAQTPLTLDIIKGLSQLIAKMFDETAFTLMCLENFSPVYNQITADMSLERRIHRLVSYCERHYLLSELLEQVKRHSPEHYRQNVAEHILHSLGTRTPPDPVNLSPAALTSDYSQAMRTGPAPEVRIADFNDFTFWDREEICTQIIQSDYTCIELNGPTGSGKSYILLNLQQYGENVQTIYINLKSVSPTRQAVLRVCVETLTKESAPGADINALAQAVAALNCESKACHFMFLFDSVGQEHQDLLEWLLGQDGLVKYLDFDRQNFFDLLDNYGADPKIKIQVVIATREPLLKANIRTKFSPQIIPIIPLARPRDLKRDPVKLMLKEIAEKRGFPRLPNDTINRITEEVYYLTGGHPKCAKQLLFAVAERDFLYRGLNWRELFKTYVASTIQGEMLSSADMELVSVFWILSVFRQFDQHLLGSLLSRGILPLSPNQEARFYASDLRRKLSASNLIKDPERGSASYAINPVVRRALSLSMQYFKPERFLLINNLALEIYTDWLQRTRMGGERAVMLFVELVYHSLKALEADAEIPPQVICEKTQKIVENEYLPRLLQAIDRIDPEEIANNRATYLPVIKSYWSDKELLETTIRATGSSNCYETLTDVINSFISGNLV